MLKFLFKFTLFLSVAFGLFVTLFLQEVSVTGNQLEISARERGVMLPLKEPRLEVDVSNLTMSLFDGETLVQRFDVAVGENRQLGVLTTGADSTPLGEYRIIRKAVREDILSRGSRFMEIDFPSIVDVEAAYDRGMIDHETYEACYRASAAGEPFPVDLPFGQTIGIQGNHFILNGSRSTDGSIALRNADMNDLYDHIPVGTTVVIKP